MLTFIGMFLFVVFGGIGLTALPMDLINSWKRRPKFMRKETYDELKQKIGVRANHLFEIGGKLKERFKKAGGRPKSRAERRAYNKFRTNVFLLEEDYNRLEKAYNKGIGPKVIQIAWAWTQLGLGVLGICLSFLWILHIFLYLVVRPPASPFLNQMFIDLDNTFGLFGTIAYGVFAFWLLWCVIKGNFKFGLRIPFFFTIHPMKIGETLMNSFLVNTLLLLLSSITVTQFCSICFSLYNRYTGIDTLFNVGVRNLRYIKYVWNFYYWALISFAVLSLGYLAKFPDDNKRRNDNNMQIAELPN